LGQVLVDHKLFIYTLKSLNVIDISGYSNLRLGHL